ncbi:hypothetical protein HDV00_002483 [Rhizophlyctis rosea]|nr:hypothetical protein HDV00_002483 [Rhizophlyctis rosea]
MSKEDKPLTADDLAELLKDDFKVKVSGADIDGIARGKFMAKSKFVKSVDGGFGKYSFYSFKPKTDQGFSDIAAHIDLSTFRRIPWEKNAPFFLLDFYNPITNKPFELCPRSLLKRVVDECKEEGFTAMCGMEFEWYNYRGPGVFEAAIEYSDALKLADRAHLFKTSVKQLALKHGIISTFMAKPWPDLPGCSGHIHFSLSDSKTGDNAFVSKSGGSGMEATSDTMRHFIAGVLEGLPAIMPMLAPTINSYKRLVENYWAPITVSYGFENRTAAIRVIAPPTCSPKATRIEVRVPGADVNPYLAISAILASGIYGVKHRMEPRLPPAEGNVVSQGGERLARDLREATEKMMAKDSFARNVLGDAFVDHYGATRKHEWKQWETAVTDWELKRYMETV